jgi:DNA-directed RNA polymerase specialized sigma24 family protein
MPTYLDQQIVRRESAVEERLEHHIVTGSSDVTINHYGGAISAVAMQDRAEAAERRAFGLPPAYRTVYFLCCLEGLTVAETAATLGISPAAVRIRLARARRAVDARGPVAVPERDSAGNSEGDFS